MTTTVQKSINDFEKHLLNKIDVYSVSAPNESSSKTYEKLTKMFDIAKITPDDIASLTKKELEDILDSICLNQTLKEKILNDFLKNKKNVSENTDYFIEIIAHIKMFVNQYLMRTSLNHEYSGERIEECKDYLSLVTSTELSNYTSLDTFDRFVIFINNQGLIDEDKANIFERINELNINLAKKQAISPDVAYKVSELVKLYFNEEYLDYLTSAEEVINEKEIDLDTLETFAKKSADFYELRDAQIFYNVILTLIIISKFNELTKDNKEIIETELNELFSKLHHNDELLKDALEVIQQNTNALYIPKEEAISYKDADLSELSREQDEAIMFKLSSLILEIKDLYDEIINASKDTKEYLTLRNELEEKLHEYRFMSTTLLGKNR